MNRSLRRAAFAVVAFSAACLPLGAQQHPNLVRGFDPEKVYQFGDFDNINLLNGNVVLTIPIGGSYPVGGFGAAGFSYGLTLVYNSKVWDFKNEIFFDPPEGDRWATKSLPNRRSNAGMGWSLSLGQLLAANDPTNDSGYILYVDPDGSEHTFPGPLHESDTATTAKYTRDGSYLRLSPYLGGYRVESPDGSFREFDSAYKLTKISDRAGNQLAVTYPDALTWTLTDSQGRIQTVKFRNETSDLQAVKFVDYVTLTSFAGTPAAVYDFTYTQRTTERHCLSDREAYSGTASVPMLTSVSLPDGSLWALDYYLDDVFPSPTCRMGAVKSVTLPTLGKVEYDYLDWHLPVGTCPDFPLTGGWQNYDVYASASPGVGVRREKTATGTTIGTTTYSPALSAQPARPVGWCPNYPANQYPWLRPGSEELTVTVTDPLGDKTKHYFSVWPEMFYTSEHSFVRTEHGLPFTHMQTDGATPPRLLSQQVFDCPGANCSTAKRSEYVRYERDDGTCGQQGNGKCTKANWRVASTKTIYNDDVVNNVAKWAAVDNTSFDGLGHYRQAVTSGNFGAGNNRANFTNYNPTQGTYPGSFTMFPVGSAWVLNTFTDQYVSENSVVAKSHYCFDTFDPTVDPALAKGLLLRKRVLVGADPGSHDVVTLYSHDSTGNVRAEGWFGGDSQNVGTGTNLCGISLPTAKYAIDNVYESGVLKTSQHTNGGFLEVNNTWSASVTGIDPATGLVAANRDTALVATSYEYDNMGRLTWIKPVQDAWTKYSYFKAVAGTTPTMAYATIRQYPNGATTGQLTDQEVTFDDFGRVVKERKRMPGGTWSKRSTIYDAAGHKTDVSQWEADGAAHAGWSQYRNFDPFGRPTTLIPPEGASHQTTLSYLGARVVYRTVKIGTDVVGGETDSLTTEIYDRQGRLFKVTEPSGALSADVTTTYGYDVGGRLSSVSTTEGATTQNRTFVYDNRGFLGSECHPEKGATSSSGCVTYASIDARGHARFKTDGPNSLEFLYDEAERLKQVNDQTSGRVLKAFSFGSGTGATDRSRGKLKKAERYNYVLLGTSPYTVKIDETYTYGGEMGRVSQKASANFTWTTWTPPNPLPTTPNESFSQAWTGYDDLGEVTGMTYPACTHAACTGAPAVGRSVSFTYNNGRLTGIPGFASSVTYHPNGMYNVITHANGVSLTQAKDAVSNLRPLSITASGVAAGGDNWTTGDYAYDGVGNVKGIGNSNFRYDKVSRLVSANVFLYTWGRVSRSQTYTYDAFGNMQTLGSLATPTSATKNRLTSGTYDAAGNLVAWNGQTYEYGPFNEMKHFCAMTPCAQGPEWLYLYTADDERIWAFDARGGSGRWTLRDLDGKVLREFGTIPWAINEDYIYREGQLLAGAQTGRFFHLDHLGTPRLVTGASAAQLAYHVYLPYGEEITAINQDATRLKFTGHERDLGDPTTNADDLDYMHARFNSPLTGRMLSVDPALGTPTRPQSWNRFAYVEGNPLALKDPTGRSGVRAYAYRQFANDIGYVVAYPMLLMACGILNDDPVQFGSGIVLQAAGASGLTALGTPLATAVATNSALGAMTAAATTNGNPKDAAAAALWLGAGTPTIPTSGLLPNATKAGVTAIAAQLATSGQVDPARVAMATVAGGSAGATVATAQGAGQTLSPLQKVLIARFFGGAAAVVVSKPEPKEKEDCASNPSGSGCTNDPAK